MLRLRNSLFPLLRAASPLPSPIHRRACRLLSNSTSTAITPAPFSLEDYLVASCGLAPAQAREVSKKAFHELSRAGRRPSDELSSSRINSASNPDAILALLSGAGLSRDDIAAVVSADPLILRASVKNIAPRLLALQDRLGLSTPQIARFVLVGSRALRDCDVIPRLEFFISFYGSFEQVLVAVKRCMTLLTASPERLIKPNIALLRQWGVQNIVQLCTDNAWVLTFKPERVKEFLLRAEELGVPPTSRMFRHAVATISRNSKDRVAAKLEFYKRILGVSESEVSTAVSKMPNILGFSDEILLRKIKFLVNEAAMEPRYIVERPVMFALSLEKRLVPRHYIMKVLQEKGLLDSSMSFYSAVALGEDTFKSKFIDRHKDSVPGLADTYAAARAGIVPSRI
ncbi:transcription termination factor MTEF1, chloroplastic-like [Miscanthus floridulus]|uniref:transcription termination factor MTEF1, chloroplastic-like n=1 Tax=Miscanthus floridulus TaxID=154761 RepID=UPI003457D77B